MENRKTLRKALCIFLSPLIVVFGGTILTVLLFKEIIDEFREGRKKTEPDASQIESEKVIRRENAGIKEEGSTNEQTEITPANPDQLLDKTEHLPEYQVKLNRKTVFSTHYALMVECFERILIDLLNETTQEDTIVIHKGLYVRLKTNCKRMAGPNIIVYTSENYIEAHKLLQAKVWFAHNKYYSSNPESFFDDSFGILLFNLNYGTNDEPVQIFEHTSHDKYENKFKAILNNKGIRIGSNEFCQMYFSYFISNYLTFKNPKSRHAIGVSQLVTTQSIESLCDSTIEAIGDSIQAGFNLNFLIPSLTKFLLDPPAEIINELVTRKPCDLPWIIENTHEVKRAMFYLHFDGGHSLFIETDKHIIHYQKAYHDKNMDYHCSSIDFYETNGNPILLMGIETEANSEGLDILAMYCENITIIEKFEFDEQELKKAHLNCVVDAEQLLFRIKGHTLDRLNYRNLNHEFI